MFPLVEEQPCEIDEFNDTIPQGIPPIIERESRLDNLMRLKTSALAPALREEAARGLQDIDASTDFLGAIHRVADAFMRLATRSGDLLDENMRSELEEIAYEIRSANDFSGASEEVCEAKRDEITSLLRSIYW